MTTKEIEPFIVYYLFSDYLSVIKRGSRGAAHAAK